MHKRTQLAYIRHIERGAYAVIVAHPLTHAPYHLFARNPKQVRRLLADEAAEGRGKQRFYPIWIGRSR